LLQGYAKAQYNLGVMYANDKGVLKDAKQAVYWYQKAADQGQAKAQYNLGVMYANGKGVHGFLIIF
jgi:TPR repeat protein